MSLESVSGKSLPSRDVSNCALHAVCYPLPTAGFEALDIQKRMGHRTGSLGAGIAVFTKQVREEGQQGEPETRYQMEQIQNRMEDFLII